MGDYLRFPTRFDIDLRTPRHWLVLSEQTVVFSGPLLKSTKAAIIIKVYE